MRWYIHIFYTQDRNTYILLFIIKFTAYVLLWWLAFFLTVCSTVDQRSLHIWGTAEVQSSETKIINDSIMTTYWPWWHKTQLFISNSCPKEVLVLFRKSDFEIKDSAMNMNDPNLTSFTPRKDCTTKHCNFDHLICFPQFLGCCFYYYYCFAAQGPEISL